ncbi:MAG TPA: hypothetical protein VLL52_22505 [Anaerolineae bacterium]|nr:hypothetical protein [Anaerolineae bacterium]
MKELLYLIASGLAVSGLLTLSSFITSGLSRFLLLVSTRRQCPHCHNLLPPHG